MATSRKGSAKGGPRARPDQSEAKERAPAAEALLDELAAALVLVEADDRAGLSDVAQRLATIAPEKLPQPARARLEGCRVLARALAAGEAQQPDEELARLRREVDGLQRDCAPPVVLIADAELIREFVSGQRVSLEELEAELLSLENGSLDAVAAIRRRVHGLKGEAGVVGRSDLAEVCHAIEDLLAAAADPTRCAGVLLQARDWINRALNRDASDPADERQMLEALRQAAQPAPCAVPAPTPVPAPPPPAPASDASVQRDADTVALYADFLHESEDGLSKVDQILMDAEKASPDVETVNVLFRVFHTVKGVSSFLECRDITELAHSTETLLNQVRKAQLELKGGTLDLVFNATEAMRGLLAHVRAAVERGEPIVGCPEVSGLVDRLKEAAAGRPTPAEPVPAAAPGEKLGEILGKPPLNVPAEAIALALAKQQESGRKLGEELVASGAVQPKDIAHALRAQAGSQTAKIQETIKVDVGRVDQLVEIIGELVVVESMVVAAPEIAALTSPRIRNYLNQLNKITRDAQDIGMRMRMVPVRGVFQKMARMVRDLSHKSGKPVRLELDGEGTEMDRSMVEQIADPLVHMIRNAMDHGIEGPQERAQAGKEPTGTLRLSARYEGDHIAIEVADDGKGLDREAILKKALAQGLVREGEVLNDAEIHQLVFLPGFSTAKQVTELSGRGVGMDVVKRNVDAMRGRIAIETTPGSGTRFTLLLPLTLAIIDGMLVRCGEERYIIPTLSIVESVQPTRDMLVAFAERGECINVRGEILPLLRLERLFGVEGALEDPCAGLVVLLEAMGRKAGLLVDQVLSQQKVVIKTLGAGMQHVDLVSGAAILSDGTVGLILNAEKVIHSGERRALRLGAAA